MGMQVGNKKGGGFSDINVTPLIDVVLVVLIIFMVITPQTIDEMAVNMPKKTETLKQNDAPVDQLVLSVCEDGGFALNANVMPMDALRDQLRRRLAATTDKVVFVDAHPEAPYDKVVELMDAARAVGAQRVGVAKLKDPDKFKGCTPPAVPLPSPEG
mgnify:CR=1 FL=1